jgi:hypothetical protein
MDDTEPIRDSMDDPPELDPAKAGHTVTDELDGAANHERPNDPTLGTTADGDPMTAVAGETGYPTPPDDD